MKLGFELRAGHLLVTLAGPFDPRAARSGMGEIMRECQAHGLRRVLIDGRGLTSEVSIADRYDLATQLANEGHGKLQLAIVVKPENRFTATFEDTAANRGLKVRTTTSMEEARTYLGLPADA